MATTIAVICADLDGARSTIQIVADAIDVDEAGAVYVYHNGIVVGYVPVVHFAYLNIDDNSVHVEYEQGDTEGPEVPSYSLNGSGATGIAVDEELDEDNELDDEDFEEDVEDEEEDESVEETSRADPSLEDHEEDRRSSSDDPADEPPAAA